ncbi:MerR family transcriptional regulator [Paenarthrobacter sp. NPDC058040]|uniref:MerR family transcriptional regulator n=1 Tax=unclassified Paenarthrobacter TaxID=2634190 RepID=UPI0036D8BDE1
MTGTEGDGPWSIGELAAACGVSVRTLHHYDRIGLLAASERTPAGHRRYGGDDVRRLYRIKALQMLGLPLASIADALDSPGASLHGLLSRQLEHVQQHARQVRLLEDRLGDLLARMEGPVVPTTEQLMTTLEMITVLQNHFTAEQREQLAQNREDLGAERIEAAKQQWAGLVEKGLAFVSADTPVSDPEVRQWVQDWDSIGSMFHSGEDTKAAARAVWKENSHAISADLPWNAEQMAGLVGYLQKARG